jgi:hypothetical protein
MARVDRSISTDSYRQGETATLINSDINNPVYNVLIKASSNNAHDLPESANYTYNADGSFSGQYTPQDTFTYHEYAFSFDRSTGNAQGSSWDGLFTNFTYLADGSGSGSGNGESETFQLSITDDGVVAWDNSVDTGYYTYTDDYSTTYAGGYTEDYSDSTGDSWVYAQNDDGVETV